MKQRIPNTTVYLDTADFNQLATPIDTDIQLSNRIIVSTDRNGNDTNQTIYGNLNVSSIDPSSGNIEFTGSAKGIGDNSNVIAPFIVSNKRLVAHGEIKTYNTIQPVINYAIPDYYTIRALNYNYPPGNAQLWYDTLKNYLTGWNFYGDLLFTDDEAIRILDTFKEGRNFYFTDIALSEKKKTRLEGSCSLTSNETIEKVSTVVFDNEVTGDPIIGNKEHLERSYNGYFNTLMASSTKSGNIILDDKKNEEEKIIGNSIIENKLEETKTENTLNTVYKDTYNLYIRNSVEDKYSNETINNGNIRIATYVENQVTDGITATHVEHSTIGLDADTIQCKTNSLLRVNDLTVVGTLKSTSIKANDNNQVDIYNHCVDFNSTNTTFPIGSIAFLFVMFGKYENHEYYNKGNGDLSVFDKFLTYKNSVLEVIHSPLALSKIIYNIGFSFGNSISCNDQVYLGEKKFECSFNKGVHLPIGKYRFIFPSTELQTVSTMVDIDIETDTSNVFYYIMGLVQRIE